MMSKYCFTNKILNFVAVLAFIFLFTNSVQAADPAIVCADPTAVNADFIKPLGPVDLSWVHGMNNISFNLKLVPSNQDCKYEGNGVIDLYKNITAKKVQLSAINIARISCGAYTLCVQGNCCNDRCDSCEAKIATSKDYCSEMAKDDFYVHNNCACKNSNTGGLAGSFIYKCLDQDGNAQTSKNPCEQTPGWRNFGCAWKCPTGFAGGETDCSVKYETRCSEPPHQSYLKDQPSTNALLNYSLCSVSDSRFSYKPDFKDEYLRDPGVVSSTPPLIYNWQCLGAKQSCTAYRKSFCSDDVQGKFISGECSDKNPQLNPKALCLDRGIETAIAVNIGLSADGKSCEWDCIGYEKEKGENRNWVASEIMIGNQKMMREMMQPHCSAQIAGCGWANGEQVTYQTWRNNGGEEIDYLPGGGPATNEFWCKNGAKVQTVQAAKNTISLGGPNNLRTVDGLTDVLNWQCVYGEGVKTVTCNAGIIKCNPNPKLESIVADSFTKKLNPAKDFTYNLCLLGGKLLGWDGKAVNGSIMEGRAKFINSFTRILTPNFTWQCEDKFLSRPGYNSAPMKCSAKEILCSDQSRSGLSYVDKQSEITSPICTNLNSLTKIPDIEGKRLFDGGEKFSYWYWYCLDAFENLAQPQCKVNRTACVDPLNTKVYVDWTSFLDNNDSCVPVKGTKDQANCAKMCNDQKRSVLVELLPNGKGIAWKCGEDDCKAKTADCAKPPQDVLFDRIDDFRTSKGVSCSDPISVDASTQTMNCCGVCNNQDLTCSTNDLTKAVPVLFSRGEATWKCGIASDVKSCHSMVAECNPHGDRAEWQKFYDEYFFGRGFDISDAQIPLEDPAKPNLNFLQFMPKGLSYYDVEMVENGLYSPASEDNDYPFHVISPIPGEPFTEVKSYDAVIWPTLIDINAEQRRVDRPGDKSYAIYHSGTEEANDAPDVFASICSDDGFAGMRKCRDYIDTANPKVKTMTRLERGIFGLYMYWKCKVIIDKKSYTYATGSRYKYYNDQYSYLNGAVPGAHWDMTPEFNRFCSFSNASTERHDKTLRPREILEYKEKESTLMKPCTGSGCYRRQPRGI